MYFPVASDEMLYTLFSVIVLEVVGDRKSVPVPVK